MDTRLHWFDLQAGTDVDPEPMASTEIRTFPGLSIHGEALLARGSEMLEALTPALRRRNMRNSFENSPPQSNRDPLLLHPFQQAPPGDRDIPPPAAGPAMPSPSCTATSVP